MSQPLTDHATANREVVRIRREIRWRNGQTALILCAFCGDVERWGSVAGTLFMGRCRRHHCGNGITVSGSLESLDTVEAGFVPGTPSTSAVVLAAAGRDRVGAASGAGVAGWPARRSCGGDDAGEPLRRGGGRQSRCNRRRGLLAAVARGSQTLQTLAGWLHGVAGLEQDVWRLGRRNARQGHEECHGACPAQ